MKKRMVVVMAVIFAMLLMPAGCTDAVAAREDTLKIYNWGEYIDPGVISAFETWYKGETGKDVTVVYREFGANEDIWTSLKNGNDWDVVCPSDYMIERMIKENMLRELDSSVIAEFNNVGNDRMKELIKTVDPSYDAAAEDAEDFVNKFCVPYIWGTFGIMYDHTRLNAAQIAKLNSWNALWDPELSGKIYMKEQIRDAYTVAMLHYYSEELEEASDGFTDYENPEYRALLDSIFREFDTQTTGIDRLEEARKEFVKQKPYLKKYEGDEGKMEMASGANSAGSLGLFWSCDAGYVMSDSEEEASFFSCSGDTTLIPGNKSLGDIVPKEGSNLWVDAWCIPKTAVNTAAANMFIKFTLRHDIATRNSEYAGAPSANAQAMDDLEEEYADDDAFFAGAKNPKFKEMYLEARFPSEETLARCAVMADFGDRYDAFELMYQNVRRG